MQTPCKLFQLDYRDCCPTYIMESDQLTQRLFDHFTCSALVPQVCTEGRLILVFTFDDLMRIKTWHFTISHYNELIPRSMLAVHVSQITQHDSRESDFLKRSDIFQINYFTLYL